MVFLYRLLLCVLNKPIALPGRQKNGNCNYKDLRQSYRLPEIFCVIIACYLFGIATAFDIVKYNSVFFKRIWRNGDIIYI